MADVEIDETFNVKEEISFADRFSIWAVLAYVYAELIVFDTMAEVEIDDTFNVKEEISFADRFSIWAVFAYV